MTDPLDTWKSKEEDAIIARSEEASSKLSCFKCGDGSTPLYCLNCANNELQAKCAEMRGALGSAWAAYWDGYYGKGITKEYAQAVDKEVKQALSTDCGKAILERQATLLAVVEQCEVALEAWLDFNQMSIPNNADEQEAQGEQFTTVWFDTKDALAAIKQVKEGK